MVSSYCARDVCTEQHCLCKFDAQQNQSYCISCIAVLDCAVNLRSALGQESFAHEIIYLLPVVADSQSGVGQQSRLEDWTGSAGVI